MMDLVFSLLCKVNQQGRAQCKAGLRWSCKDRSNSNIGSPSDDSHPGFSSSATCNADNGLRAQKLPSCGDVFHNVRLSTMP